MCILHFAERDVARYFMCRLIYFHSSMVKPESALHRQESLVLLPPPFGWLLNHYAYTIQREITKRYCELSHCS